MQSRQTEIISLARSCLAVAVPSGQVVVLAKAARVELLQALGGSFTVKLRGRLYRIDGRHADALGRPEPPAPATPEGGDDEALLEQVWQQLRSCFDPEIPVNIVELGLVYRCRLDRTWRGKRRVRVEMTLTAPTCGMGSILVEDVRRRLLDLPLVDQAEVKLVFDPPWDASRMSEAARLQSGLF